MSDIDVLAVLAATVASFALGGLWYSPILFAKAWMRESNLTEEQVAANVGRTFAGAFVLSLVIAVNLAFFLGPDATVAFGASAGALAGVGWGAAALGVTYLFERRSLTLWLIDGGFHAVSFTLMGTIIGAWP